MSKPKFTPEKLAALHKTAADVQGDPYVPDYVQVLCKELSEALAWSEHRKKRVGAGNMPASVLPTAEVAAAIKANNEITLGHSPEFNDQMLSRDWLERIVRKYLDSIKEPQPDVIAFDVNYNFNSRGYDGVERVILRYKKEVQ